MATIPFVLTELQTAARARLTGDATLMAMIHDVYDADAVPAGLVPPYITFGSHVSGRLPTFRHANSDSYFLLDIWSNVDRDEAYAIFAEVLRLLEYNGQANTLLVMPHFGHCRMECEWSTALYDPVPSYWHVPARFRSVAFELS